MGPEQIRRYPELSADAYVAKGPLAVVANNLLMAIKYLEERGRGDLEGGIFGYEGFRSRRLVSEMLAVKGYWDALMRSFDHGVLGLDEEGRILLANPAATRLLGEKEVRLVGESVAALTAGADRQAMQEALSKIKKARLPEDHRLEAALGKRRLLVRLSGIVEDGACKGILVILEPHVVESGGAAGTGTGTGTGTRPFSCCQGEPLLATFHDVATLPVNNFGALESRARETSSALHRSGSMRHRQCLPCPTGLVRAAEAGAVRRCPARGHPEGAATLQMRASAPESRRGHRAPRPPGPQPGPPCTAGRSARRPRSRAGAWPPVPRLS